jgi:hypothetical protein
MFSMPLAYSSTLDQRQPVAHIRDGRRPTWRSLGARTSRAVLEKRRQKHTLNASVCCKHAAPRVFLSQAGPRFDLDLFKLSITFVLALTETLRRRKKATRLGRPRLACYAANDLARTPSSEGRDVTRRTPLAGVMPAREHRDGGRRFGWDFLGFDGGLHGFPRFALWRIDDPLDLGKRSEQRSNGLDRQCDMKTNRNLLGAWALA